MTGKDGALGELYFHFLSNRMGYGCGDSFPYDSEPNRRNQIWNQFDFEPMQRRSDDWQGRRAEKTLFPFPLPP